MKILEGLKYSGDHEWVKMDGDIAYVGITDYAQHTLGDIVYVELPEIGEEYKKEAVFGVVESVKTASDVFLPVSGTVVKVNDKILENPALVNQDPFENWMICIEINNPDELKDLMSASEYSEFCHQRE